MARTQQDEILKAARAKDAEIGSEEVRAKRSTLEVDESTEFVCGSCSKGGTCLGCHATVLEPEVKKVDEPAVRDSGHALDEAHGDDKPALRESSVKISEATDELLYRCVKCKRLAHYAHLVGDDEDMSVSEIATHFQVETDWQCGDCASFTFHVEKILAWRPYPANAPKTRVLSADPPNYKDNLPREYLVKWDGRSYRRAQWVPHMWLSSTAPAMLKNFLATGTKAELLPEPYKDEILSDEKEQPTDEAELPAFATKEDSRENSSAPAAKEVSRQPPALVDAEDHIPPRWKTVDRLLDIRIWSPSQSKRPKAKKRPKGRVTQIPDDDSDEVSSGAEDELRRAFSNGDEPTASHLETIEEFENRTNRDVTEEDIDRVVWAFIKWDDLAYDECAYNALQISTSC